MKRIAFTSVNDGALVFTGSESPAVLLIDSAFETISVKRVTVHRNRIVRLWQRLKSLQELEEANAGCAVYWCSLNKTTGYLCVSNLCLHESAENDLDIYVAQSKRLKLVCSQLMSIGNSLPSQYRQALMVLGNASGVRHVYFINRKPVFTRLLQPGDGAGDYVEPLLATHQHLINRGILEGEPMILCHGVSAAVLLTINESWAASTVSALSHDSSSLASLANKSYSSKRLWRFIAGQLPAYCLDGLKRYRFRSASILCTSIVCALMSILVVALLSLNYETWSKLLRTRTAISSTIHNTQLLHTEATAFSTAPKITAQRLQRLDLLRSLQPAGPDVLLAIVSDAFESHPDVTLNHISWFTVIADEKLQSQTQISHRDRLSMNVVNSDYLSILIIGNIKANSLSEKQALFSDFKATLMSLPGIDDLVEEQTPVTQWRMPDTAVTQHSEQSVDSFTLRFSLSHVSS